MRLIPGNTKVQVEIFKGVGLWDMFVGVVELAILALIIISNLPLKWMFIALHVIISVVLLYKINDEANYMYIVHMLSNFGYKKKFNRYETDAKLKKAGGEERSDYLFNEIFPEYNSDGTKKSEEEAEVLEENPEQFDKGWIDMEELSSFESIADDLVVFKGGYYGAAIEISDVEFRFFSDYRRTNSIENGLGAVLRSIKTDYTVNILKIERPIEYRSYELDVYDRIDAIKASYEKGMLEEDELKSRLAILYTRLEQIQELRNRSKIVIPFYYLIICDADSLRLNNRIPEILNTLHAGEIPARRLDTKELAVMLKYSNTLDFNEKDIDRINPEDYAKWAMPSRVEFMPKYAVIDGIMAYTLKVVDFPVLVPDAWLAVAASYPSTKVVIKFKPMDGETAVKAIDKSIQELRTVVSYAKKDSSVIGAARHMESLQATLEQLKGDNEMLLCANIYITVYDVVETQNTQSLHNDDLSSFRYRISGMRKLVHNEWRENGMKLSNLDFRQVEGYIASQVSGYDPFEKKSRGIPSNTIAGAYPWIFPHVMDESGINYGSSSGIPVFLDFFERNSERVNSNMVIIGKSGSGKSYATKTILSNLAADDAKIFVLDPEDEYRTLAKNLHGKYINVANNESGIINPFNIIASLDDEEGTGSGSSYAGHLQFLEEFFRVVLPDCDRDALEYLNSLIEKVYKRKGIGPDTDISKLKVTDYPTFDDLSDEIVGEYQATSSEYIKTMLRPIANYISKFSSGGRNSNIWNGYSSIETDENFTVFNFQSLLASRNTVVANAQMMLVLKYLDNEIIKNRAYNEKYGLNRKIVVVIDEAHVFIDDKFPVALDFMYQLAKRIRKYNGMQIVITQNVKDFVGSEEIERKSTAIINACQYSFIFALSPNDMDDLCKLYDKAGKINEVEQNRIIAAPRGQAFVILGPNTRTSFMVNAPDYTRSMFEHEVDNPYFTGSGGQENWIREMGDSVSKHDDAVFLLSESKQALKPTEEELEQKRSTEHLSLETLERIDRGQSVPQQAAPSAAQPAAIAQATVVTDEKTNSLLEGLINKLGEISDALVYKNTQQATPDNSKIDALTGQVQKLAEAVSGTKAAAPAVYAPAAAPAETLQPAPAEEESEAADLDSLFDLFSRQVADEEAEKKAAEPAKAAEESRYEEDDFGFGDEESSSQDNDEKEGLKLTEVSDASPYDNPFANFDVFKFFDEDAEEDNEEVDETANEDFDAFMDGSQIRAVYTVSIEDLINYNKRQRTKQREETA